MGPRPQVGVGVMGAHSWAALTCVPAVRRVGLRLTGKARLHWRVLHHLRGDAEGNGGEQGGDMGTWPAGLGCTACRQALFQEAPPRFSTGFSLGKG